MSTYRTASLAEALEFVKRAPPKTVSPPPTPAPPPVVATAAVPAPPPPIIELPASCWKPRRMTRPKPPKKVKLVSLSVDPETIAALDRLSEKFKTHVVPGAINQFTSRRALVAAAVKAYSASFE
jgi:hypothetical protein